MKKALLFALLFFQIGLAAQNSTLETLGQTIDYVSIGMLKSEFLQLKPSLPKANQSTGFRQEIVEKVDKNGLEEITYVFDNDGEQPLYEFLIEFADEKTRHDVAREDLHEPNYPNRTDHWVVFAEKNNPVVILAWEFGTKLVLAANLPSCEFENDPKFKLPADFDLPDGPNWNDFLPEKMTDDDRTDFAESLVEQLEAADENFQALRGEVIGEAGSGFVDCKKPLSIAETASISQNEEGKWMVVNNLAFGLKEADIKIWVSQLSDLLEKTSLKNFKLQAAGSKTEEGFERKSWAVLTKKGKLAGLRVEIVDGFYESENGWAVDIEVIKE